MEILLVVSRTEYALGAFLVCGIVFTLCGAVACAGIGAVIDGGRGAILGALLGPIGLVITAILAGNENKA